MWSSSAFGSADNTFFDLDYSGYYKNVIQYLFIISRMKNWYNECSKGFSGINLWSFSRFWIFLWTILIFIFDGVKEKPAIFFLFFFIIVVCEHEQPEELGNTINLFYFQLTLLQSIYWEWYWVRVHWELMKILYIQTFQSHVDKFFEAAINLFLAACYNIVPICLWY